MTVGFYARAVEFPGTGSTHVAIGDKVEAAILISTGNSGVDDTNAGRNGVGFWTPADGNRSTGYSLGNQNDPTRATRYRSNSQIQITLSAANQSTIISHNCANGTGDDGILLTKTGGTSTNGREGFAVMFTDYGDVSNGLGEWKAGTVDLTGLPVISGMTNSPDICFVALNSSGSSTANDARLSFGVACKGTSDNSFVSFYEKNGVGTTDCGGRNSTGGVGGNAKLNAFEIEVQWEAGGVTLIDAGTGVAPIGDAIVLCGYLAGQRSRIISELTPNTTGPKVYNVGWEAGLWMPLTQFNDTSFDTDVNSSNYSIGAVTRMDFAECVNLASNNGVAQNDNYAVINNATEQNVARFSHTGTGDVANWTRVYEEEFTSSDTTTVTSNVNIAPATQHPGFNLFIEYQVPSSGPVEMAATCLAETQVTVTNDATVRMGATCLAETDVKVVPTVSMGAACTAETSVTVNNTATVTMGATCTAETSVTVVPTASMSATCLAETDVTVVNDNLVRMAATCVADTNVAIVNTASMSAVCLAETNVQVITDTTVRMGAICVADTQVTVTNDTTVRMSATCLAETDVTVGNTAVMAAVCVANTLVTIINGDVEIPIRPCVTSCQDTGPKTTSCDVRCD